MKYTIIGWKKYHHQFKRETNNRNEALTIFDVFFKELGEDATIECLENIDYKTYPDTRTIARYIAGEMYRDGKFTYL